MDQALYHPQHGYYSSGRAVIGRSGDFFTNVSVGPLFGRLLAAQFVQVWQKLGSFPEFVIVEQGAHLGHLARDILEALRARSPDLFSTLRYRIIEPFTVLQERQTETLADFRKQVEWCQSLDCSESFTGIHFSNELLDAMPVHLVRSRGAGPGEKSGDEWEENLVDWQDGRLVFVPAAVADASLAEHVSRLPGLPAGYETEINLTALDWTARISAKLTRGIVLMIDYGYPRDEYYAPHRSNGTLQCRVAHRLVESPLERPGECDITAHVDWTSIAERAEAHDLRVAGFCDQHHFLTGIISEWPGLIRAAEPKTRRALQTLLHPEMLGRNFQILGLSKDFTAGAELAGFKFGRDPRIVLGLKQ